MCTGDRQRVGVERSRRDLTPGGVRSQPAGDLSRPREREPRDPHGTRREDHQQEPLARTVRTHRRSQYMISLFISKTTK